MTDTPETPTAETARDDGMQRVEEHADEAYKARVVEVIRLLCERQAEISSDDVMDMMKDQDVSTHDARVIGPMFIRAKKLGYCKPLICNHCGSFVTRKTTSTKSHASPMHIWQSLLFKPEPARPELEQKAYEMGLACAMEGPNSVNSHFTLFATPSMTKAWEDGKRDGSQDPIDIIERQHRAIDQLFALLIERSPRDDTFYPSKSGWVWDVCVQGSTFLRKHGRR